MTEAFPNHPLAREARLALAGYDQDPTARLRCVEQLLISGQRAVL